CERVPQQGATHRAHRSRCTCHSACFAGCQYARVLRHPGGSSTCRGARCAAWRHRPALARVCQSGHVSRLHPPRCGLQSGSKGAGSMNAAIGSSMLYGRSPARGGAVHVDTTTIAIVMSIVLLGLIMVTSASVSIASQETGQPFYYLERQLLLTLVGGALAAFLFCIRTELLERLSMPLLIAALLLLFMVLVPGLGHTVNGSRRWLHVLGLNFQVSELARVLVLIYLASYAVRRQEELRTTFAGLAKPLGLVCMVGALLLAEPD